MSLPQHSKCSHCTGRASITHIFTIPLTSTNHVSRSKCNGIEVHIRRVINSVPNFIEYNDVFDARIISLKHQYPVEQLEYGNYVEFQKSTGKPCTFQRKITCLCHTLLPLFMTSFKSAGSFSHMHGLVNSLLANDRM